MVDDINWMDNMKNNDDHSEFIRHDIPLRIQCSGCKGVYPVEEADWNEMGEYEVIIKPHLCIWLDDETNSRIDGLKIKEDD